MEKRVTFRLNEDTGLVERYVERRFGAHWSGVSAVQLGTLKEFQKRYPNERVEGVTRGNEAEAEAESLQDLLRRATPEQLEELGYLRVVEDEEVEDEGDLFEDMD